ncbi:MAG: DUF3592 domain-containing protein [Actinoallomurus sp.]
MAVSDRRSISGLSGLMLLVGGWLTLVLVGILTESQAERLAYHGSHAEATVVAVTKVRPIGLGDTQIDNANVRYQTPTGVITTSLDLSDSSDGASTRIPVGKSGHSVDTFGVGSTVEIVYDPRDPTRALPADIVKVPHKHYRGNDGGPLPEPAWTTKDWLLLGVFVAAGGVLTLRIIHNRRYGPASRDESSDPYGSAGVSHDLGNGARI